MHERLMIVDANANLSESLRSLFAREGYDVYVSRSAETALNLLEETVCDLILADMYLPGINGIELLRKAKEKFPEIRVILMTEHPSLETAISALRSGAFDYVIKPVINEEMRQRVKNAFRQRPSQDKERILIKPHEEIEHDYSNIIGESPSMKRVIAEVKKVADARSNVLLLGETGTGKELFARTLHNNSNRCNYQFIPINCSAIPENLLESELFGHIKGAFTSAVTNKRGLFEEANGGTILLDEIGDLTMALQSKLLRVVEDQEIRPVGGVKSIKVDLRFVTATNKDIEQAVRDGKFREDLFYRINTITIKLPPLRERKEDIDLLIRYYLHKYSHELGRTIEVIDHEAMGILLKYCWPGNIRELQNIIERAILMSEDGQITKENLPERVCAQAMWLPDTIDE